MFGKILNPSCLASRQPIIQLRGRPTFNCSSLRFLLLVVNRWQQKIFFSFVLTGKRFGSSRSVPPQHHHHQRQPEVSRRQGSPGPGSLFNRRSLILDQVSFRQRSELLKMDFRQAATRTRAALAPAKAGPALPGRQGNRVPLGDISGNQKAALETRRPLKAQVNNPPQFESRQTRHLNFGSSFQPSPPLQPPAHPRRPIAG